MEIKINNLRNNLIEKLEYAGWSNMLSPYINGLSFDHIMNTLVDNVNNGKRFTPKFKNTFNAFIECPYKDTKVVIVGQDPYPQLGVADGIAFSCSNKGKAEKSLQYILKQTIGVNKIGSHYGIWKSFTEYLFDSLNRHKKDLVFILMGRKAEEWAPLLSNMKIYKVAHPASAAYRGGEWDCKDVFNKVNNELTKQGKTCIEW